MSRRQLEKDAEIILAMSVSPSAGEGFVTEAAFLAHTGNAGAHHAAVTIGGGGLSAKLALSGQVLTLASIDHSELSGIGPDDHHAAATVGNGLLITGQQISLNTPGSLSVSSANNAAGNHTHVVATSTNPGAAAAILATTAAGLLTLETLAVTGNIAAGAVNSHWVPSLTDTYDLGSATKLWRKGWLSELESILFVENTISAIGGWFIIPHGQGTLAKDVGAGDTEIDFGQSMTVGDIVLLRGNLQVEYVEIETYVFGSSYDVIRNLDGSGANDWPAGQVFIVLGTTGDGRIELDAQTAGPRISIIKQGATYNAQTEVARLGDLSGNWGYLGEIYGIALGEYGSNKPNMVWDAVNGLRIRNYGTDVLKFDVSGNADISGVLRIGASGGIYQGSGTFASPTTGLKIWNDGGVGRLGGYLSGVEQVGFTTQGKISAGAGRVRMDVDGITVIKSAISSDLWSEAYKFVRADGTTKIGGVRSTYTSTQNRIHLSVMTPDGAGYSTGIVMEQLATYGSMTLGAYGTGSSVLLVGENLVLQANNIATSKITASTNYFHITGAAQIQRGSTNITAANGDNHNVALMATSYIVVGGPTAAFAFTGFTDGADGRLLILRNGTGNVMTLKNENASSTAANRINTGTGGDIAVAGLGRAILIYDTTSARWMYLSKSA